VFGFEGALRLFRSGHHDTNLKIDPPVRSAATGTIWQVADGLEILAASAPHCNFGRSGFDNVSSRV
jgi:hypothetical protein